MDQKLKNYSSGMQVRLAFSMAIRSEADILLIDEVLAVGDADFQRKCFSYFKQLKKNNKTVVFVSHDMSAVREYCDRCLLIDKSKQVAEGMPDPIAEKYIKLFNQDNNHKRITQKKNEKRWGDKAATVETIITEIDSENLKMKMEIIFNKNMDDPIIGFLIKDETGKEVCGTNTKILRSKLGNKISGEKVHLEWSIPNFFNSGSYSIDTSIGYSDGVMQADWWHNATTFICTNESSTPYLVTPKVNISIK